MVYREIEDEHPRESLPSGPSRWNHSKNKTRPLGMSGNSALASIPTHNVGEIDSPEPLLELNLSVAICHFGSIGVDSESISACKSPHNVERRNSISVPRG